jgi:hypothetical protein
MVILIRTLMGILAILTSLSLLVLSMDWNSLLGWSKGTQEMAQYPDARLYKAASLLTPEERPTVPVSLYGGSEPNVAYVPGDKKGIFVNRNSRRLKDPNVLAAKLAHEQIHVNGENDEIPAYEKELGVLRRLSKKNNGDVAATQGYLDALKRFRSIAK